MMNSKKTLYSIGAVIIVIITILAVRSQNQQPVINATSTPLSATSTLSTTTVNTTPVNRIPAATPVGSVPHDTKNPLVVYHSAYPDDVQGYDVNTYSGTINAPTQCHVLKSFASLVESTKEVMLTFSLTGPAKPNDVCAQAVTPKSFMVSISAPVGAKVRATLNGSSLPIKVVEK